MKCTAAEYETSATVKLAAAMSGGGSSENEVLTIAEAQVYATLAVAQAIEKVWDELHELHTRLDLAIPHPDD